MRRIVVCAVTSLLLLSPFAAYADEAPEGSYVDSAVPLKQAIPLDDPEFQDPEGFVSEDVAPADAADADGTDTVIEQDEVESDEVAFDCGSVGDAVVEDASGEGEDPEHRLDESSEPVDGDPADVELAANDTTEANPADESDPVEPLDDPAEESDGELADDSAEELETAEPAVEEEAGEPADVEQVEEPAEELGILDFEANIVGPSGAGWKKVGGAWRYTNPKTKKPCKDGVFTIAGEKYCFDPDGAMVTGWMAIDGEIYYFDPSTGAMATSCDMVIKGLCAPLGAADGQSFKDVSADTPHAEDISWAFESGISTGWVSKSGRTFRPLSTLARADMAAFLYRLAGSPAFVASEADSGRFSDVTPDTPHAAEIWWLANAGISKGWEEQDGTYTFRPLDDLARADMAAFLYRLAGSPSYKPTKKDAAYFSDVTSSTPHAKEIRWLGSTGISTGFGSGSSREFWPYDPVRRQDMASFLHRAVTGGSYKPSAVHEYRFDDDGTLVTGWSGGSFYDPSTGALIEAGWAKDGSKWSYIDPETGKTLRNGLHEIAGYTYCFNSSGLMRRGWVDTDKGTRCFSKVSGAMYANGIYEIDSDSYCFAKNGALRLGLVKRGSSTYYFDPKTGKMVHGYVTVDGEKLFFDNTTGKLVTLRSTGNAELDKILWAMVERFGGNGLTSLRAVYDWVGNYNTFPYVDSGWRPSGSWRSWSPRCAIDMYNDHEGACYHYASLTGWFAYALGYDARIIAGQSLFAGGWLQHGWVEIDYKGKTVMIDTQQHAAPRNVNRNFFMVEYDKAPLYYRLADGTKLN